MVRKEEADVQDNQIGEGLDVLPILRFDIHDSTESLEIEFDEVLLEELYFYASDKLGEHLTHYYLDTLTRGDSDENYVESVAARISQSSLVHGKFVEIVDDMRAILTGAASDARDLHRFPPGVRNIAREIGFKFVSLNKDGEEVIYPVPDIRRRMKRYPGHFTGEQIAEDLEAFLGRGLSALFQILVYQYHRESNFGVVGNARKAQRSKRKVWFKIGTVALVEMFTQGTPYFGCLALSYYGYLYATARHRMNKGVEEMRSVLGDAPDVSQYVHVRVVETES